MQDIHASDETLYMNIEHEGRGVESGNDVYKKTKIRVACYKAYQKNVST